MINDKTLPKEAPSPEAGERPEIYAVKSQKEGAGLSRRSFLGAMAAAGALTGGLARCSSGDDPAEPERTPPRDCGSMPAHATSVLGLLTVGDTLFSWSQSETKAWSWTGNNLIAAVGSEPGAIVIEENFSPFPILFRHVDLHSQHKFSADGNTLVKYQFEDGVVEIWSVEEGEPAKIQTMRDMKDNIYAVSLSSDGKNIAIGKLSGSIEIFNIGQDEPRITLRGNFLIGENETRITINMINKLKILSLMVVNENILLSGNNHDEFEVWNLAEKNSSIR